MDSRTLIWIFVLVAEQTIVAGVEKTRPVHTNCYAEPVCFCQGQFINQKARLVVERDLAARHKLAVAFGHNHVFVEVAYVGHRKTVDT